MQRGGGVGGARGRGSISGERRRKIWGGESLGRCGRRKGGKVGGGWVRGGDGGGGGWWVV